MHYQRQAPALSTTSALSLLTLSLFATTTFAAGEHVDSAFGNVPALDCNNVFKAWDLCAEHSCSGQWEEAGRIPVPRDCNTEPRLPCPPGSGNKRPYLCRKVSGGYDGWGMRNALLGAYFNDQTKHCWVDATWLTLGARGTYRWVALRSNQHGGWINIEFQVSDTKCQELK